MPVVSCWGVTQHFCSQMARTRFVPANAGAEIRKTCWGIGPRSQYSGSRGWADSSVGEYAGVWLGAVAGEGDVVVVLCRPSWNAHAAGPGSDAASSWAVDVVRYAMSSYEGAC